MERPIRSISLFLVLALAFAACAAGASPTPAGPIITPPPATGTPGGEPTEEPTEAATAEPTAAATGEPTAEPATEAPTAGTTAEPSPSPTIPPVSEEGTLTLWVDETRAELMTTLGADFTAEFGVPVSVQQVGFGDIRDQLKLAGPAEEGPDIIIGAHDWLGELVASGLLMPLDLGDKAQGFDPTALEAFTYEGQLYGMPYATEAIALYYNTSLVPQAPATWEELKETARTLQEDGTVEQGYVLQEKDPYHSYPIMTGFGGYIFGQDAEGNYDPSDVGLDSDGGLAYARELDSMVDEGLLRAGVDYTTMMTLFTEGQSAMFMTGPWELPNLRESGIEFGVAPIPTMEQAPRPFVGVQGFMVSAFGQNQLLAQTFLTEFVATDEAMTEIQTSGARPPAWTAVTVDDPELAVFMESGAGGDPLPAIPEMSSVWEFWTEALDFTFTQSQDAEEAFTEAAADVRAAISGQ